MGFILSTERELFCKAEGNGSVFAKKGAMVAEQGQFHYEKRLLGTNGGNVVGQVFNHVARRVTGENLELMECKGQGTIYFADQESHIVVVGLEPGGVWDSICVESEDLLAFTEQCHYGVTIVGQGVQGFLGGKGLFTSQLKYNGAGAQVAIKTKGNPLVLQSPCRVDPDALVAWTGPAPSVKLDIKGFGALKTLIGQTSGETYMFEFNQPGQIVIVQPYERESGLKIGMDGGGKPQTQSSAGQNTMDNLGQTIGGMFGGQNNNGQNQGGGLGSILGNLIR